MVFSSARYAYWRTLLFYSQDLGCYLPSPQIGREMNKRVIDIILSVDNKATDVMKLMGCTEVLIRGGTAWLLIRLDDID